MPKRPYRREDQEHKRLRMAIYREKNKVIIAAKSRVYRVANRDRMLAKGREYWNANRESGNEKGRLRYARTRERVTKRQRAYYAKNRDYILARTARYNTFKYNTDPQYKLQVNLRNRLHACIVNKSKRGSAVKLLGCTAAEAVEHLKRQFTEGMSWDNHGEWHIDHILPLASFDLENLEQLAKACHYTNLQPLWKLDNIRKGAKILKVAA